jgi:hypothetical protein
MEIKCNSKEEAKMWINLLTDVIIENGTEKKIKFKDEYKEFFVKKSIISKEDFLENFDSGDIILFK